MHGLMMNEVLRIAGLLQHAAKWHADTEIVSRLAEGGLHRYTYHAAHQRAWQRASALQALGIQTDDRIGTLAWNTHRHFELYYGVSAVEVVEQLPHTATGKLLKTKLRQDFAGYEFP